MSVSKIVAAAASGAGGNAGLDVDDCFSCHLYEGNGSTQTITNNIDLSSEGGLVWLKMRTASYGNSLYDTARGVNKRLRTEQTSGESTRTADVTAFTSSGFTMGSNGAINGSGSDFVSWTWRNSPMFQCLTYTGNGVAGRQISHNLGSAPGMVIVKATDVADSWYVFHRSLGGTKFLELNATSASATSTNVWQDTAPSSTVLTVAGANTNTDTKNYVAYLFAHHANDGSATGFGPNGDSPVISCGSYTGNGSASGPTVDLGFEPQWILQKSATKTNTDWAIADVMRGFTADGVYQRLRPNRDDAEGSETQLAPTSTGFKVVGTASDVNTNGETYIYMAIRRGPLAVPDDATKVFFQSTASTGTALSVGFVPDFWIGGNRGGTGGSAAQFVMDRLRGKYYLGTSSTAAEIATNDPFSGATTNTFTNNATGGSRIEWLWKRAPSYFDAIAYSGDGSPNDQAPTLTHNLAAVPEMVWCKRRNNTSNWAVAVKSGTGGVQAYLDANNGNVGTLATTGPSNTWSDYFTSTQVIGDGGSGNQYHSPFPVTNLNASGNEYIMYLFCTLEGVSKCGSYDGNGSNQNIECGFSSGARFILIKSKQSGSWYVFDTVRGIVAGNDSHLKLDSDAAEAYADSIDTYSGGFNVVQNSTTDLNKGPSDESYIFYAIA